MTRKSCAVEMHNAILRNYLKHAHSFDRCAPGNTIGWLNHVDINTRHPASWRENICENLSTSSSAAKKNPPRISAEKLFVSLVFLLRSFSKDLSEGKRYFVEVVNCASALSVKPWSWYSWLCEELHEDFFKLASMELYAYMLNNFNRLQDPNFRRR